MPPANRQPHTHGKPFDISELNAKAAERPLSKRDAALVKALREAAALAESQVVPFYLSPSDKVPTVLLAARKLARKLELNVNIGARKAYPETILLSRGSLRPKG